MKLSLLALAFAVFGTPMLAEGISVGAEVETEYNMDAEKMTVIATPEVSYGLGQMTFTGSSAISLFDSSAADHWTAANTLEEGSRPDLDIEFTYDIQDNLQFYAETGWDIDAKERKDIVVGTVFSF